MRKDLDYRFETESVSDSIARLAPGLDQNLFGLHFLGTEELLPLLQSLPEGFQFPLQIMSGPALTLRYWSSLSPVLVDLVKTKRIRLVVHLPFVLTFYKEPRTLQYQTNALAELSNYYHTLGIWEQVTVLAHCGHPSFTSDGSYEVQKAYYIPCFQKNVASVASLFSQFLLENLPGWKEQPEPWTEPSFLYETFLKPGLLPDNVHLAFDTEHYHASGKLLSELSPAVWKEIKFCHLNTAPANAPFGSLVDLHSYTTLVSAFERGIGVFNSQNPLELLIEQLQENCIPSVFERKLLSAQVDDLIYCRSLCQKLGGK